MSDVGGDRNLNVTLAGSADAGRHIFWTFTDNDVLSGQRLRKICDCNRLLQLQIHRKGVSVEHRGLKHL